MATTARGRRDSHSSTESRSEASSIASGSSATQSTSPTIGLPVLTHSGRAETFLSQLWSILENKQWKSLIYWSTSGLAIVIPDEQAFVTKVASKVYSQSSIQAFNKQMNMWGFNRGPRSLKQLSKKGLGGDTSMHDGKTVHRLWVHPIFVKGASEDDRATISRKLDGGGKKEGTKPSAGGFSMKKKPTRRRADYDDDDEDEDEIEEDSDEGSDELYSSHSPAAVKQSPTVAIPASLPPLPSLPAFASLPPLPQLGDSKKSLLPPTASGSPKTGPKALAPPRLSKSPQAPAARALGPPPTLSHSTSGKRMPSNLLPSPDASKRRKTLPASYARGLPTPADEIESSTDQSDDDSDLDDLRAPPSISQRPISSHVSPQMRKAELGPAPAESRAGPSQFGQASLAAVGVSAYGRKSPAALYYAPSEASRYGQPSHSHPTSRHRVVLLTSSHSPAPAAPAPPAPLKAASPLDSTTATTSPAQSSVRALAPNDSTSSLFGRPSSQPSHENLRTRARPEDDEADSLRSTRKAGSSSSQEDNALDLGSQRSREDESSIRTGQEFRYQPLPVPSHHRLRSPSLSPSGTAALALRPSPHGYHTDPMLLDEPLFSQPSFPPPPASQASSQGESIASTATSSQPLPLPLPSVFLNGEIAEGIPFPGTPTPPLEPPPAIETDDRPQPRERQNSGRSDGKKSKGKPLARAMDSLDGPAPLMRGPSELFDFGVAQPPRVYTSYASFV